MPTPGADDDYCGSYDTVNVTKCKTMTFSWIQSPVMYTNIISDLPLSDGSVTDLGLILSSDLDPRLHIERICRKATETTLGFVLKLCRASRLSLSFKVLYRALVRPIVEYGAVIWDPRDINDSIRLERVQRKFMRSASLRLSIPP